MPLDATLLNDDLLNLVFSNHLWMRDYQTDSERYTELGRRYAVAYADRYAAGAQSCGGIINTSVLPAQRQLMATTVAAGLQTAAGLLPTAAAAIVNGMTAFWANPLIFSPIPPALPATLIAPAGAPVALAALIAAWTASQAQSLAGSPPTADQAAQTLATIMDTYTKAVVVTHPLPPPAPPCALPLV